MHSLDGEDSFLERERGRIYYRVSGKQGRPLIVLTHGSSLDHRTFDDHVNAIGQEYRVLVWDVRGHGRSKPIDHRFSLAMAVDDLVALIQVAGYQQAVLVGHSMGSYICQEAIFRDPERILAFVSVGAGCITLPQTLPERFRLTVGTLLRRIYPYEALKNPSARLISTTPRGEAYVLDAMNQLNAQEYKYVMAAIGYGFHAETSYQIRCPLLLVCGEKDYAGLYKDLERWAARDQAPAPIIIPNVGHLAPYDNAAFFTHMLLEFLSQQALTSGL